MSGAAMVWAAQQRVERATDKLTLLMVASDCRQNNRFFASLARLAETTGFDRKTIPGSLRRLQEQGLIVDTGEHVGRTRQIVVYSLPVKTSPKTDIFKTPENGELQAPKQPENGHLDAGKVPAFPVKGPQKRATYTVYETESPSEIAIGDQGIVKRRRFSDDWQPRKLTGNAGKVAEHWSIDRHQAELSKFANHHQAKGSSFADWDAAWRSWVCRSVEFERNSYGSRSDSRDTISNPMVRAALER